MYITLSSCLVDRLLFDTSRFYQHTHVNIVSLEGQGKHISAYNEDASYYQYSLILDFR